MRELEFKLLGLLFLVVASSANTPLGERQPSSIDFNSTQGQGLLQMIGEDGEKRQPSFDLLELCLATRGVHTGRALVHRSTMNSSTEYNTLNWQWNKCCGGQIYPLAYILVEKVTDIQTAVTCARKLNVRIVVKGGGHSYGKFSFGDSNTVVVDLQKLAEIRVDKVAKTANVGPGVILGPLVYKLYQEGKFGFPVGQCPPVGISFVTGGGYGDFSRLHGAAADSLVEVDMIDAKGRLLRVNNSSHPDLFWALRGGGAGSFGIVTNFKLRLFDAPHRVVVGTNIYDASNFTTVLQDWDRFHLSNPSRTINALMRILPAPSTTVVLQLIQLQTEAEAASIGTSDIEQILTTNFTKPLNGPNVISLDYLHFFVKSGNEETGYNINITNTAALQNVSRHDFAPDGTLRAKTFYAPRDSVAANYDRPQVTHMLQQRPEAIIIILRSVGGKIADVSPTDTAFVHRGQNLYEADVLFIGPSEDTTKALPWMRQFYNLTKKLLQHTESYQNHLDIELTDYMERYYGANAKRLIEVKKKYDPSNVFHNPQSIPTNF